MTQVSLRRKLGESPVSYWNQCINGVPYGNIENFSRERKSFCKYSKSLSKLPNRCLFSHQRQIEYIPNTSKYVHTTTANRRRIGPVGRPQSSGHQNHSIAHIFKNQNQGESMAWANVDNEFIFVKDIPSRIAREMAKKGFRNTKEHYGFKCVMLWSRSQSDECTHGEAFDILEWAGFQSIDEAEAFAEVLCKEKIGILERVDGQYRVRGNDKHIKNIRAAKLRAKHAAQKRWEKAGVADHPSDDESCPEHSESQSAEHAPSNANARQCNTMQSSSSNGASSAGGATRHRFNATSLLDALDHIPAKTKKHWCEMYPDKRARDVILKKCFHYYDQVKPRKKPKTIQGWSAKFGFWLDNDYEKTAKAPIASDPKQETWYQIEGASE